MMDLDRALGAVEATAAAISITILVTTSSSGSSSSKTPHPSSPSSFPLSSPLFRVSQVYLWLGSASSRGVRSAGAKLAERVSRLRGVGVTRVREGCEPVVFGSKFADWARRQIAVCATPQGLGQQVCGRVCRRGDLCMSAWSCNR
jgi:hypothetical protein